MFLNKKADSLKTKIKENQEGTKTRSKFYVKTEISPTIRDFARGKRKVLQVDLKI
ncbi:MAG: hypothetical protein QNJ53_06485 [Pleurocapsa sp. MO_192.B19]|nr:hypothetical protein [Pleurocapsa sp. MO_192.B19]